MTKSGEGMRAVLTHPAIAKPLDHPLFASAERGRWKINNQYI